LAARSLEGESARLRDAEVRKRLSGQLAELGHGNQLAKMTGNQLLNLKRKEI
jgi:hypothetical protein